MMASNVKLEVEGDKAHQLEGGRGLERMGQLPSCAKLVKLQKSF